MAGRLKPHPTPKGPLAGVVTERQLRRKPARPGVDAIGTEKLLVPVAGLTANFSPIPRMAPPPFGRDGAWKL